MVVGAKRWVIAEGYIPSGGISGDRAFVSHETACILNTNDVPANIKIEIYFADREPAGPYEVTVQPRRNLHLRFNDLSDPEEVPRDTDYSSVVVSDVPIVVQHTRLDSRDARVTLMTTLAFAA
ncbi:MAG: sensory rhodopsin transducer [Hyphomicrobiaceae bacterium]